MTLQQFYLFARHLLQLGVERRAEQAVTAMLETGHVRQLYDAQRVDPLTIDHDRPITLDGQRPPFGDDVPTLKEVEDKIQARYAKAKAASELTEVSVESRVLEVEQATANVEAQGRLSELRAELGLDSAEVAAPEVEGGTA